MNIKESAEKQRIHFNNMSEGYSNAINDIKARYYRWLVYKLFFNNTGFQKTIENGQKLSVLEAMCGTGSGRLVLKNVFGQIDIDYDGFDYSDEIIEIAKKQNPEYHFFQQDVNFFSTEKKYDIIMLLSGLHHVPDNAGQIMKNLQKCLKPGGYFISIEPTYNNSVARFISNKVYKHSKFYDYETERRFSLKELNSFFSEAGYSIEKQIYPGLLAYLLWFYNPYPRLLKIGNKNTVKRFFRMEHRLYSNWFGKKYSVATFTILKKE